jgi:hypothetical protein
MNRPPFSKPAVDPVAIAGDEASRNIAAMVALMFSSFPGFGGAQGRMTVGAAVSALMALIFENFGVLIILGVTFELFDQRRMSMWF